MVLSLSSVTSPWPLATASTANTPPMTIMHPTLSVSSTIPATSTSSSPNQATITSSSRYWGSGPDAIAGIGLDMNPYWLCGGDPVSSDCGFVRGWPDDTGTRKAGVDESLYSICEPVWRSSFFQWFQTGIETSTLPYYSCYDYAPSNGFQCQYVNTLGKGSGFSCYSSFTSSGTEQWVCHYPATTTSDFTCQMSLAPWETPLWTCDQAATPTPEMYFIRELSIAAKAFSFTAAPPCCGGCSYTAGDVQVYYWSLARTSPLVSRVVNSEDFTFTYPSVYVAFHSIAASGLCGNVGTVINRTTIAFDASDLSTAIAYTPLRADPTPPLPFLSSQSWWTYSALNLQTSLTCTNITATLWTQIGPPPSIFYTTQLIDTNTEIIYGFSDTAYTSTHIWAVLGTSTDYWTDMEANTTYPGTTFTSTESDWSPYPVVYNPCAPFLSVPSQIITLDPRWSTCYRDFKGLHDPPILLTPSNGFSPVSDKASVSNEATVTTKAFESPQEETQGAYAVQSVSQAAVTKTPSPRISKESDGRIVIIESTPEGTGYGLETQAISAGGPAETIDGTVVSLLSDSGGTSVVIGGESGGKFTEDVSALTGGGLETGKAIGGGSDTGEGGVESISGSVKIRVGVLVILQILYCLFSHL